MGYDERVFAIPIRVGVMSWVLFRKRGIHLTLSVAVGERDCVNHGVVGKFRFPACDRDASVRKADLSEWTATLMVFR